MSSDSENNKFERLFKLWASVQKLILDGKRDIDALINALQAIVDDPWAHLPPKFILSEDFGVMVVPEGCSHDELFTEGKISKDRLVALGKDHLEIEDWVASLAFPDPSYKLKPGDLLRVQVFEEAAGPETTLEDQLKFLGQKNAVLPGLAGAALVGSQKLYHLERGREYLSPDVLESLPTDGSFTLVPHLVVDSEPTPEMTCEIGVATENIPSTLSRRYVLCFTRLHK